MERKRESQVKRRRECMERKKGEIASQKENVNKGNIDVLSRCRPEKRR